MPKGASNEPEVDKEETKQENHQLNKKNGAEPMNKGHEQEARDRVLAHFHEAIRRNEAGGPERGRHATQRQCRRNAPETSHAGRRRSHDSPSPSRSVFADNQNQLFHIAANPNRWRGALAKRLSERPASPIGSFATNLSIAASVMSKIDPGMEHLTHMVANAQKASQARLLALYLLRGPDGCSYRFALRPL